MSNSVLRFVDFLRQSAVELHQDNPLTVSSAALLPTPSLILPGDAELFWEGVTAGLLTLERGGRFNTRDRPIPGGRWRLLAPAAAGGSYNAEYLPQIAGYVHAILHLGFPPERVLFELPGSALHLDLAILNDHGGVVVLAEAKRDAAMLSRLRQCALRRFAESPPSAESARSGDEAGQFARRLWTVAPRYAWLIGPGRREAYACELFPLRLSDVSRLPRAQTLGLDHRPSHVLAPPSLVSEPPQNSLTHSG